jgi:salicylate hydroxylase
MFPHQSQGACMAIEDAAAIGILFSKPYFSGDVEEALEVYEKIRLPRVTKVQASAAKAATNINERIGTSKAAHLRADVPRTDDSFLPGFSSNTNFKGYKVEDEKAKLTIEEMNA